MYFNFLVTIYLNNFRNHSVTIPNDSSFDYEEQLMEVDSTEQPMEMVQPDTGSGSVQIDGENEIEIYDESQPNEFPLDDGLADVLSPDERFHVSSDMFSESDFGSFGEFLDKMKSTLNSTIDFEFAQSIFEAIMEARVSTNVTIAALKKINSILLKTMFKYSAFDGKEQLKKSIITFAESDHYQMSFVKSQNVPFVEPQAIKHNGTTVGYYNDIRKQAGFVLANSAIVKSIIEEESEPADLGDIKIYNSELTCCPERRGRILGALRLHLGIDDYSVTSFKSKFLIGYLSFSNIPIEQRLKRKDIFLAFVASRAQMKKSKTLINDVLQPIVSDLSNLANHGINVNLHLPNATIPKTIKVVLSAVVADNLGETARCILHF